MTRKTLQPAAKRTFLRSDATNVVATIYTPVELVDGTWGCEFEIVGLIAPVRTVVRGVDGLQALTVAIEGVRVTLAQSGEMLVWEEHEPGDSGIPRYSPKGFGLAMEARLVAVVEKELAAAIAAKLADDDATLGGER